VGKSLPDLSGVPLGSVAAGVAALLLLMFCIFLGELMKSPAELRRARIAPPTLEFRTTIRNDAIHQNVMELEREFAQYGQFKKKHRIRCSERRARREALATLTSRFEKFGR